jgi:hypothetical protein
MSKIVIQQRPVMEIERVALAKALKVSTEKLLREDT